MRLDKFLSDCKVESRKNLKKIIKQGAVSVNGVCEKDPGKNISESDTVTVYDQVIEYEKYIYLMMNKPQGYISATDDPRQRTVLELLEEEYLLYELFPAGRLDIDTEGFLLLTNDGKFAHDILSPKKHVPKTYFATVEGHMGEKEISAFNEGMDLGDFVTKPATLEIIDFIGENTNVYVTISEGKFHQIKRMFEKVGSSVLYLKRISMGGLTLDDSLSPGEVKKLTKEEINLIKETK